MSKRKYSAIWFHFDDEDGQRAKCKHCSASLSIAGGCRSNLKRHLIAKHNVRPLNIDSFASRAIKFEDPFEEQSLAVAGITVPEKQEDEFTEASCSPPPTDNNLKQNDYNNKTKNIHRKKYSVIWLHFDDDGDQRAKCKYCKATLSYSGGCHGNLRRHMRSKHPLTVVDIEEHKPIVTEATNFEEAIDEDPLTSSEIRMLSETTEFYNKSPIPNGIQLTKKVKNIKRVPNRKSTVWAHFADEGHQRARCKHCRTTISFYGGCHGNLRRHLRLKHSKININSEKKVWNSVKPDFNKPSITAEEREQIDRQVLKMIVKGHHSFHLLNEPEFHQLIHEVSKCPGYELPAKKVLSDSLLPSIHMEMVEDIKVEMQSALAVCLSTDAWISTTNVNCLAVTAHYINDDTTLSSHLLQSQEFENNYTPETVRNFIKNIILDFQLNDKVAAIVTNGELNVVTAIHQGDWRIINCFAHSLKIIVETATAEIADTLSDVRKIVDFFLKNDQALKELQAGQVEINHSDITLKKDAPKRWNSTFEMLQKIYQIKDAVVLTLSLYGPELMLTSEDWQIIEEAIPILNPFYEVILEISAEKTSTLSKVTVIYNLLDKHIAKCLPTHEKVMGMVKKLQLGMASCFGNLEKNKLYAECTILDPRFKNIGFRNETSYKQALDSLRNKIYNIQLPNVEEEIERNNIKERRSLWEAYDLEFNKTSQMDNNTTACIRELDKYMNEEYLDRRRDPLVWWKERKHLYPRVYMYALKRLCIVSSSIPGDRLFSASGQLLNERRTLLNPYKMEGLVFLQSNM